VEEMKEFEKKPSPNREPSSEGMKGLSKFLPMTDSNYRRRLTEYEVQVQDLQAYVRSLETETVRLRKKVEDAPRETMVLENKLREANRQLVQSFNQNEKLVNALYEAREQISSLREEVDKLCAPPSTYGVYLSVNEDGTVNILSQGRKVKVNLHPSLKAEEIKPGQELVLKPGETKTVNFRLDKRSMAFYDVNKKDWVAEPGEFEILIGSSSQDIRLKGKFVLETGKMM